MGGGVTGWSRVRLGDVLTKSDDWIRLEPECTYREVTVRNRGQGAVLRRMVTGAEIAGIRRMRVHHRQFIVSRIDARHGSTGIIPAELEGAIVTNDFPVFSCREGALLPEYLGWYSKTPRFVDECRHASEGSTNRVRLKEPAFLEISVPLPPISEQLRTTQKLDQVAAQFARVQALHGQVSAAPNALLQARLSRLFGDAYSGVLGSLGIDEFATIEDLSSDVADGPHVTPQYVDDGIPFITVLNMTSGRIDFRDAKRITLSAHEQYCRRAKAELGDVLISKDGTIGVPCYVDTEREFSFFVSVALVKPRRDLLDGRFLTWVLRAPYLQDRIVARSRGDMIRHLILREIRQLRVPVMSVERQCRIVADLDRAEHKHGLLAETTQSARSMASVLMRSALASAFNDNL